MVIPGLLGFQKAPGVSALLPLDFDPNPFTAWSFARALKTGSDPSLFRARRTPDNGVYDVGVLSGEIDVASYLSFLDGGTGFAEIPYDQGPNGNNGVQAVGGLQSEVVSNAVGSKYGVDADGDSYYLIPDIPSGNQFSVYVAINHADLGTTPGYLVATNAFSTIISQSSPNTDDTYAIYDGVGWKDVAPSSNLTDIVLCYVWDNTSLSLYKNGVLASTITTSSPSFDTQTSIFSYVTGASRCNAKVSELLIYESAHDTSTLEGICGSMVGFYVA